MLLIVAALRLEQLQELHAADQRTGHDGAGRSARRSRGRNRVEDRAEVDRREQSESARFQRRSADDGATCERAFPASIALVAESGIHTAEDVTRVRDMGVDAILVGEALVTASDVGAKVRELVAR